MFILISEKGFDNSKVERDVILRIFLIYIAYVGLGADRVFGSKYAEVGDIWLWFSHSS
jgi:hypothetical protein